MKWPVYPFEAIFEDVTGGNLKTLQSDYLPEGKFPIVDQGQQLIGGYTDDEERLCKANLPVVVFGDHTKTLKFIDFPFCLGADGTKILRPQMAADPRYLFYFLQTVTIPDAGYSRHFKYLKKAEIPLPPLDEQKRIAAILDQADALRRLRTRALDRLNALGQAIFHEMFGDPVENSKRLSLVRLGDICDVRDGTHDSPKYVEDGYPLLTSKNFSGGNVNFEGAKLISKADFDKVNQRSKVDKGDIVMPMIGTIGSPVIIDFDPNFAIKNVALIKFTKAGVKSEFIHALLSGSYLERAVDKQGKGGTQKFLSLGDIRGLMAPLPSEELQAHFGTAMRGLARNSGTSRNAQAQAESLFTSLQLRAFRGEL